MTDRIMILIGICFVLFVGISIPVFFQIWRTTRNMDKTLNLLNQRLPLIMNNIEEITTGINRTSDTVYREVENMAIVLRKVQGVVGVIYGLEEIMRRRMRFPVMKAFRTSFAVARGVRAFIDFLSYGDKAKIS